MKSLQATAVYPLIAPVSKSGAAADALTVDTAPGGNWASEILVIVGLGVTGADPTTLKLTHCDTVNGTYTDITGGDFAAALAAVNTDPNHMFICNIGLSDGSGGARKRYLRLANAMGTTTLVCAYAVLGGFAQTPISASERGAGLALNTTSTFVVTTGDANALLTIV